MKCCLEHSCTSQNVVFQIIKRNILACDGMWNAVIDLAVVDRDRSVTRCRITSLEYQVSVCFSNTFNVLWENKSSNSLFKTGSLDRIQAPIKHFCFPIPFIL